MNGLDIALLILLIFFFLRGIFRGFVIEMVGIVGLVVGFILASYCYSAAGVTLKPFIQNETYRHVVGFEIVFLLSYFLVSLLGLVLNKLVKVVISNVANGLLGAGIALGKGLFLAAVVLMAMTVFVQPDSPLFKDSLSWPYMKNLSDGVKEMVPPGLKISLENKFDAFNTGGAKPVDSLPETLKPKLPELSGNNSGAKSETTQWKQVGPDQSGQSKPAWPTKTNQ
ncbi:MAG: CvpA family protein [Deltaproteobacteria bacterium]|nr:CvpA family protein [Deltaproteobacteria bacterium]